MADEADLASEYEQETINLATAEARYKVASMPKGNPGECDLCDSWSGRLVEGVCAPCRDKYRL